VHFAYRNLLPNRLLDLIAKVGSFLNAHAGGGAKMKFECATVDARKEISA
jgi:hypothetical protein